MLHNPPFSGNFPIIQSFGEHPEFYQQFSIDGVPQKGHNGIDYRVALGTPIQAVADGSILEVGHDPDGYGHYVVVAHVWGQTLYGHLSEIDVVENAVISAGEQLGLSGISGTASEPHLHFGLRISPFSFHDGWFGYSDPTPYLRRITEPSGPIMGPHLVGRIDLELLEIWQPRMLLVLDPNPDEMRRLRQVCPKTTIIARVFATDHEIAEQIRNGPRAAAQWAHDKIMERMNPHVDYWQFANEVLQRQDELSLLNQFELERMRLADSVGYKCAILAFSVGNPDLPEDNRMECWEKVYPAIEYAEINEHIIAVHQYGMPDLLGPEGLADWLILRLEHQVLMRLPHRKVKFAVTEYGIDGLIQGPSPSGWKHFTNAEDYAAQLMRNGQYLERFSGRILGYAVFTLGHYAPWGSYDIMGAVSRLLAENSDRGVWSEITIMSNALGTTSGDIAASPGAGNSHSTDELDDKSDVQSSAGVSDDGMSSTSPTTFVPSNEGSDSTLNNMNASVLNSLPQIERRVSEAISMLNGSIRLITERPDVDLSSLSVGDVVYLIRDVFTTRSGSWEVSDHGTSVTQWARDDYLKPFGADDWFDDAGADHHLFGAVIGLNGELIREQEILFWSDGFERLSEDDYVNYTLARTKTGSGWANQPMGGGSSYVPERGEAGPWSLMPSGVAEVYSGGGLPANHHVSTFVVWQAVELSHAPSVDVETEIESGQTTGTLPKPITPEPITPEQNGTQSGGGVPVGPDQEGSGVEPKILIEQRLGHWIEPFNMSVRAAKERPDAPSIFDNEEIVYVLKDLFTTRDGSWELSDKPGSISDWAREYLKPFGAPDYFDDAGGDRHLFAAVLDLDGTLIPNKQIVYWSDGIERLGDADYGGYVYRETKDKSGWINIPIGPGSNYVPERDESGPWCWAPAGASDVVCGGGLPAKQHISTFAVWQAVRKEDLLADTGVDTDAEDVPPNNEQNATGQDGQLQTGSSQTTIFMPFVSTGASSSDTRRQHSSRMPAPIVEQQASEEAIGHRGEHTPIDFDLDKLRADAWIRVRVEYDGDSLLAKYARQHQLGMPATDEFEVDGLIVQGYAGGIVFVSKNEPTKVNHVDW